MNRRKVYGEPCDSMLIELAARVDAGEIAIKSKEWWRAYQIARSNSPDRKDSMRRGKAEADRRYYERHRRSRLDAKREYDIKNKTRIVARARLYYLANRERILKKQILYRNTSRTPIIRRLESKAVAFAIANNMRFTDAVLAVLGGPLGIQTLLVGPILGGTSVKEWT